MSAQLLRYCFWLSGSKLCIIPLKCRIAPNSGLRVEKIIIKRQVQYRWLLFFLFSFLVTCYDLFCSWPLSKTRNLVRIIYHIFLLLIKIASMVLAYVFQTKCTYISMLINNFFHQKSKTTGGKLLVRHQKRANIFLVYLWTSTFVVFIFYLFITPTFSIFVPCLHDSGFVQIVFSDCKSIIFRTAIWFAQFSFMVPVSAMASTGFSMVFLTLSELDRSMKALL